MSRLLFGLFNHYQKEIAEELLVGARYQSVPIDILVVVHNQVEYLKKCVDSIFKHTTNFHLYIWDNDSDAETKAYLCTLPPEVKVITHGINEGFIIPNNRLAAMGSSPYVVLLNSDTEVMSNWHKPLIGWLQQHPDVAATGYQGCKLNEEFKGGLIHFGYDIDYVSGWCLCFSRDIYQQVGLFDEDHLHFAYAEDCDFSFRLKEKGYRVYAFHMTQVAHYENKTISKMVLNQQLQDYIHQNHAYLRQRWEGSLPELRNSVLQSLKNGVE